MSNIFENIEKTRFACDSVFELRKSMLVKAISAAASMISETAVPLKMIDLFNQVLSLQNKTEIETDETIPPLFSVRKLEIGDLIDEYYYSVSRNDYLSGGFYINTAKNFEGYTIDERTGAICYSTGLLHELFPFINVARSLTVCSSICSYRKTFLDYLDALKVVTQDVEYQKKCGVFLDEESLIWANKVMAAFVQEILEQLSEDNDIYKFAESDLSRKRFEILTEIVDGFISQEDVPENVLNRLESVKLKLTSFTNDRINTDRGVGGFSFAAAIRFDADTFACLRNISSGRGGFTLELEVLFFIAAFFKDMQTEIEFPVSVSFLYRNIRMLESSGNNEYSAQLGDFAVLPEGNFCSSLVNSFKITNIDFYCIPIGGNAFVFMGPDLENLTTKSVDYDARNKIWNSKSLVSTQGQLQSRTFSDEEIFEGVQNCESHGQLFGFYNSLKHSVVRSMVGFVTQNLKPSIMQNKNIKPQRIKKVISTILYREIRSACFHPHVSSQNSMCSGTTRGQSLFFLNNKQFLSFSHLIKTLLKTHNINSLMYNPHINMYSFFNGVCSNCNLFISDEDLIELNETAYHRSCCIELEDGSIVSSKEALRCSNCGNFALKTQMKRVRRGVFNCSNCQTISNEN